MMLYKNGRPYRMLRPEWEVIPKTVRPEAPFNPYALFKNSPDLAKILARIVSGWDLRPSEKLVLIQLLLSARPSGKVHISNKALAKETAISERRISAIVGGMEKRGWIKRTRNPNAKQDLKATVYEFILKWDKETK